MGRRRVACSEAPPCQAYRRSMGLHTEAHPSFLHALVDRNLRERLEELAERNDRSLAAEIRRAVAFHVERERHLASIPVRPREAR